MTKFFRLKRLKIVEQIGIVLFFAVLIPMTISGIIINNINQQSVRSQLRESAILIANMVSDEIDFFTGSVKELLEQVAFSLSFFPTKDAKLNYLEKIINEIDYCENLEIVKYQSELSEIQERNKKNKKATVYITLENNDYLVATYTIDAMSDVLFRSLQDEKRQIYVLREDGRLMASHNYTDEVFSETMRLMPKYSIINTPVIFGDIKNQPLVYVKKAEPKITIIVNTTEKITKRAITDNRIKIFLSVLMATLAIMFVTALYTYYLYINIRQLFKGIIAISKGNYERQIRLLTTVFTPHEIVFLAFEFNRMASEIHKSYKQLKKNNRELKQLNEFRSNLIDTVSHELRTPLTSIQGYTSRLMRQDITIDEETRQKSLRIIKTQSERLKRMIEDLLTVPDIDGMRLRAILEQVWLPEVLESANNLLKNREDKEIIINVSEDFPFVLADKGRLEQVFVNLLENAVKYATPDSKITVDTNFDNQKAYIQVKNDCEMIPKHKLEKLFGKFIRLDDNTTRTTRGTGLGLFIVKGLVEAMNGKITLSSTKECGFSANLELNLTTVTEVKNNEKSNSISERS